MKIISLLTQKGGTGKTTSTANIGTALTRQGFTVLYIDLDPQGDLTDTIAPSAPINGTILNVLQGTAKLQDAIITTAYGDILPADIELDLYEPEPNELYNMIRKAGITASYYDYLIIDNPPALTAWTTASIYASDYIVVPALADRFGTKSVRKLLNTVETIRETTGKSGNVIGVLLTWYNGRTILARQAREYLQTTAKQAGTALFNTEIRECTAIKEAQAASTDLYTYAPRSNGAADYRAVTAEILERIHACETEKK